MNMIIDCDEKDLNNTAYSDIEDTTFSNFNLADYISNYTGCTKYLRLKFIIEQYPLLKTQAYNFIIKDLQLGGLQISIFTTIFNFLDENIRKEYFIGAGLDDMIWKHNEMMMQKKLEALESDLSTAKSSMIKESIRMGHNDIGSLFYQMGNLHDALKSYLRSKDFCTLPRHNCELCLNVITVSIDLNQFFNVSNYINKVTDYGDNLTVIAKINATSGLLCLRDKQYKQAAFKFLSVDPILGNNQLFNSTISSEDIALFGTICALAAFNRKELYTHLIDNKLFMNGFLSLFPDIKSLARSFYDGNYGSALLLLTSFKSRLLIDIHIYNQAENIIKLISDRIYLQYLAPYCIVDLSKMANVFNITHKELEDVLISLISTNQYNARIDSQTNTLHRNPKNNIAEAIQKVISLSKTHTSGVKREMLRLSLLQHGLIVDDDDQYTNINTNNNTSSSSYNTQQYNSLTSDNYMVTQSNYTLNQLNDNMNHINADYQANHDII